MKFKLPCHSSVAINPFLLLLLISIFLVITANVGFFRQANASYPFSQYALFILSMAVVLTGVLLLVMTLFSYRYTIKAVIILFLLTATICGYFTDNYGTVYDTAMLQNALQTDKAESQDLLSFWLFFRVILLGIIPSILVIYLPLNWQKFRRSIKQRLLTLVGALALILVPILAQSGQFASFFREHKHIRMYTNPATPIYAVGKLASIEYQHLRQPKETIMHATDAHKVANPMDNDKPNLVVFVVGETARADHVPFNGYERQTFPKLARQQGLINFSQTMSCGTSTAYSVPCIFAYANADSYDVDLAPFHENVMDTLHAQGVKILWRDNNTDSKQVMDKLPAKLYQDYKIKDNNPICVDSIDECRDQGMLVGLDKQLNTTQTPTDTLIVLHQMGNHGPAYDKRYDDEFRQFTPVCTTNELAQCEQQSLINAYDNALLATDDFLNAVIDWLKSKESNYNVSMIYVSDHGESLGEKGLYLHGMSRSIAPIEQQHVPMFFWSDKTQHLPQASHVITIDTATSHDTITPTLLQLFNVQTQAVDGEPTITQLIADKLN